MSSKRGKRQPSSSAPSIRLHPPVRSRPSIEHARSHRTNSFTRSSEAQLSEDNVSSLKGKSPLSTKHLVCWFLKQISPGILIVLCFLNYQSMRRTAVVSAVRKLPTYTQTSDQQKPRGDRLGARVPKALKYLADLSTPYNQRSEIPFFWDIHFAGETLAEAVFSKCHSLVQASEHGLKQPKYNEEKLQVFEMENGAMYVNVDTYTMEGIKRAKELRLAEMDLTDVAVSPYIHLFVYNIFSSQHKGRMFALFRDPIDRAISMYNYLSTASWDPLYNPKLKTMTLQEYARSSSIESNWMTRFLINKPGGRLSRKDMLDAKEVLRTKCLVGLFDDIGPSLTRFQEYFGWSKATTRDQPAKCRSAILAAGDTRHVHQPIEKNGAEWNAIAAVNKFDLELYEYATLLYKLQGEQIFGIPA